MHHLPQFLLIHGGSRKKNKNKKNNKTTPSPLPKPKLERMNARKNINYEPPDASSSCSLDESSYSLSVWSSASEGNRLFNIPTSFRIDGSDVGQVDLVCRSLGFDSADELGIPIDSWNASKIRSSSDLVVPVGASRLSLLADCDIIDVETVKNVENFENVENVENRCDEMVRVCYADVEDKCDVVRVRDGDDTGVRIGNGIKGVRPPVLSAPVVMRQVLQNEDKNGCDEIIRGCSADVEDKCDVVRASGGMGARVGNGIKGVRPPVLSAPVVPRHVLQHEVGCEWDDVRSFASREGFGGSVNERFGLLDEEEEGDVEDVSARIERVRLSASCSFSTSNDDDSSSSTTEPLSSGSPSGVGCRVSAHGRFRHITITHWQRGDLLGRGSFGSVYEGICDGGYFIAIKEVSLLDQGEQGRQSVIQLEQEIALLSQFEHDNIVRYYGTDKDDSKLYIFLELVTKGSLLSLYQRYRLQDCQVSSYTRQILHGLKYLHDRHVVHRDVKCANILVDANGSVKLADFGLAKATTFNDVKSCKGTAFWMAPEVVNQKGQGYGLAADIWSLGCTVLEMLTHRIPYSPMECMAALFKIGNGIPPPVPDNLSREARDFISQCFRINPADRPTASQLLDHPFVRRPLPLSTAGIIS